jgi:hypothetical protein
MTKDEAPPRASWGDPIEVYLANLDCWIRLLSRRYDLPGGIASLRVMPQTYPPRSVVDPDTYGDRIGIWGDGRAWLAYWASLGGYWVNLGIAATKDGEPYIAYESQWRKGDPVEVLPDGGYPAFNFHG